MPRISRAILWRPSGYHSGCRSGFTATGCPTRGEPLTPPRLFVIPATAAPVAAVIRRGPTEWCQIGRWDLAEPMYEPGAWFHGTIYPQKCDLSADGRWFAYSAMKQGADWPAGSIYEAISRLPWLTALAAWEAGTTYTRGIHFDDQLGQCALGDPDVGDATPCLRRYGISLNRPEQFLVERRRGWTETDDTTPREEGAVWDEERAVTMRKPRPGDRDEVVLHVEGGYAAVRRMPDWYDPAGYYLVAGSELVVLGEAQWADWDAGGRLLVATTDGRLQILDGELGCEEVQFEVDLAAARPDPQPPPDWAAQW